MLALAIVAVLAAAETPPADPPTNVTSATVKGAKNDAKDPNRTVCRSEASPGSRMTTRVCMTQQQWDRNEEASHQLLRDAQGRTGLNDPGPSQGMRLP